MVGRRGVLWNVKIDLLAARSGKRYIMKIGFGYSECAPCLEWLCFHTHSKLQNDFMILSVVQASLVGHTEQTSVSSILHVPCD